MDFDTWCEFLECAGILEFDHGLSRPQAERQAMEIVRQRHEPQPELFREK